MKERNSRKKKLTTFGRMLVQALSKVFLVSGLVVLVGWYYWSNNVDQPAEDVGTIHLYPAQQTYAPTLMLQSNTADTLEPELAEFVDSTSEKNGTWYGLCKKRSIQSVDDFRRTVENDPTLSVYYAGFNWEEAKIGNLKEDVIAYVAHRKGDVIQPTTKPLTLPKGDQYITDGVRTARTYCCNDIDLSPAAGTEAANTVMEQQAPTSLSDLKPITAQPGGGTKSVKPSPEVKVVPEPGTLLLMGLGLLTFAAFGRKKYS